MSRWGIIRIFALDGWLTPVHCEGVEPVVHNAAVVVRHPVSLCVGHDPKVELRTGLNVVIDDVHIFVPVRSGVFVIEPDGVDELVHHRAGSNAAPAAQGQSLGVGLPPHGRTATAPVANLDLVHVGTAGRPNPDATVQVAVQVVNSVLDDAHFAIG